MKKLMLLLSFASVMCIAHAQQPAPKCQQSCCQQAGKSNQSCCQQAKKEKVETISVTEFAKRIKSRKVVVLDVRTPKEYAEGHLKGALNVVWGNDFNEQMEKTGVKTNKTVAVYCRSGRRSKAAANALVQMGYTVIDLDGGILAWEKAGMPIVK